MLATVGDNSLVFDFAGSANSKRKAVKSRVDNLIWWLEIFAGSDSSDRIGIPRKSESAAIPPSFNELFSMPRNVLSPRTATDQARKGAYAASRLLARRLVFQTPRRLTDIDAWHLHLPFAFLIVTLLRPKVLVELGTHKGDSYCAFCQAVDELSLETACFAVDTWTGDKHAGFYGPQVLEELRTYHDSLYGRFSRLVVSDFDAAATHFADGSIDLLHVDGLHTYEAVSHDIETWLPRMSAQGVMLLHDINVREGDFGVWKAWNELSVRFRTNAFKYGHGLGAVAVGDRLGSAGAQLFNLDAAGWGHLEAALFALGQRCLLIGRAQRSSTVALGTGDAGRDSARAGHGIRRTKSRPPRTKRHGRAGQSRV
jgi:Methyltransferase domain